MRKSILYVMICIMMLWLHPGYTWARTGYVTDRLILNFRQAPDNTSDVIKALTSDTPVVILEETDEFYKIELESSETGWVDKRFITFDLPKTHIIEQLTQENSSLKDKIAALTDLEPKPTQLDADSPKTDTVTPDDQNQTAPKIAALVKENQMLQQQNLALAKQVELSGNPGGKPLKTDMIKWFLSGVGVLLIGWMIGRSVSFKRRKSRSLY